MLECGDWCFVSPTISSFFFRDVQEDNGNQHCFKKKKIRHFVFNNFLVCEKGSFFFRTAGFFKLKFFLEFRWFLSPLVIVSDLCHVNVGMNCKKKVVFKFPHLPYVYSVILSSPPDLWYSSPPPETARKGKKKEIRAG